MFLEALHDEAVLLLRTEIDGHVLVLDG